ncbi:MAG: MFS transporter, partial [Propionibacteriaceae bacterium]|nr:MFS transporter [Propionibacteriaceae bacterium]
LVTLLLAVLFLMGNENMLLMLVVVAVRGFGQGIQSPAASALTPQLVPTEHLMRFNGIQSMAHSITMFASPMLAGALLTVMPIKYIFFIDVVTAAIGIAVVFFCVHVPPLERTKTANGIRAYFDDLKTGLRYIAHTTWLKILFGYLAFFCVSMTPASMLTPLQVSRTFGNDVWRLTAIEVLFSLGMVLGGVAVSAWGGFRNRVHTVILACLVFGATMVLFGVISNFAIYLTVMVLCGVTVPFFNTPIATVLQTKIDPQIMGRIFSLVMMVNSLATPIGMLLFGPLSDVVKIEYLLIATGTLVFLSSFVLRMSKDLEAAGEPMPTPAVT